jgi:putative iron-regulated protein
MNLNLKKVSVALLLVSSLTACVDDGEDGQQGIDGAAGTDGANGVSTFVTRDDVLKTNANIAYAAYADSLISAETLETAITTFVADPSSENMLAAKQAWLDAREPYGQTEVYRFRDGPIEDREGSINAWPLGEAVIDYVATEVDGDENSESAANALTGGIIANTVSFPTITTEAIDAAFEKDGDERFVTTGYHAIEFLLWGQDLNEDLSGSGIRDNSAGQRPVTDYSITAGACTSGEDAVDDIICTRRGEYLKSVASLLVTDLTTLTEAWEPSGTNNHYQTFIAGGDSSLALILEGMGRLSFGELAGERINIALVNNVQEDEHSCFSDNTHRDIFLNAKGVQNSYNAEYTRIDGEVVSGASIYDLLVVAGNPELANTLRASLEATMAAAAVIDTKAKTGTPFDNLIQEGFNQVNVVAVIEALSAQTDVIENVIDALGVTTGDIYQDTEEDI